MSESDPSRRFDKTPETEEVGQVRDCGGLLGEEPLQDLEAALPHMGSQNRHGPAIFDPGCVKTSKRN